MFFEKLKWKRMEKRWEKCGRKDLFTWIHRYLRLHQELLEDPIYKDMFYYHRATLVAYAKRDIKDLKTGEEELLELVDLVADDFNRSNADRVNACKPLVEELYKKWNDPDREKEIHT